MGKLEREEKLMQEFQRRKMNIQIHSTADNSTHYESLLEVKYLFQKMLPKMPKDYILRQVFDEKHCSMTLNELVNEEKQIYRIIGAVCYRPCFKRQLNEIIFFAIDTDFHVNGFGAFLFNCLKEVTKLQYFNWIKVGNLYLKHNLLIRDLSIFDNDLSKYNIEELYINNQLDNITEEVSNNNICESNKCLKPDAIINETFETETTAGTSLYLLTYADNSAIGFFKKQGFSLNPRSQSWIGYIKDYEGGTLVECKIFSKINYLKKYLLVKKLRTRVFEEMKKINNFHILYNNENREDVENELIQEQENETSQTRTGFLNNFLNFLICSLQSNPSSWPFLEPVSIKDVRDYFDVIKHPMDMSLICKKIKMCAYENVRQFGSDIKLMCTNCMIYNGSESQYSKCAENIMSVYQELIKKYMSIIERWGYEV